MYNHAVRKNTVINEMTIKGLLIHVIHKQYEMNNRILLVQTGKTTLSNLQKRENTPIKIYQVFIRVNYNVKNLV